jgi:hypothetical protein
MATKEQKQQAAIIEEQASAELVDFAARENAPDIFTPIHDAATVEKPLITILRPTLMGLFDKVLNSGDITDPEKLHKLAQLRARIDIELKDF